MKLRRRKGQAQAAPMSLSSEELMTLMDRRSGEPRLGAQFRRCSYADAADEIDEALRGRLIYDLPRDAIIDILKRRFS